MRTKHFYRTMPPESFVAVNRREWEELHQRLNGEPVPKDGQNRSLVTSASLVETGALLVVTMFAIRSKH